VPWAPIHDTTPTGFFPEPVLNEPGIQVLLYDLPEGAVFQIGGVGIEGTEALVPESPEPYRIDVLEDGQKVWTVEHPGDVDGEYAVWLMSPEELTESSATATAAEDAAGARRQRPTMRRRPRGMMRR
jgi:hypothetical protein